MRRRRFSLALVLLLVVQSLAPAWLLAAGSGTGPARWVVLCTASGLRSVQLPDDAPTEPSKSSHHAGCPLCLSCPLCASGGPMLRSAPRFAVVAVRPCVQRLGVVRRLEPASSSRVTGVLPPVRAPPRGSVPV